MIAGRALASVAGATCHRLLLLPKLAAANGPLIQCRRHLRGVQRIYRNRLERYKLNLRDLPPLTEHLSATSQPEDAESRVPSTKSLDELWADKVAVYKSYLPADHQTNLLDALFNPQNNFDSLLRIIDENLETMNSFYVANSFEALDDMIRAGRCHASTVLVAPEFARLCSRAIYKVRFFESDEVLKLLKCLSAIRLPEETLLAQAAFQMARHLINDYNSAELATLDECLRNFEISDNSKRSLLLALREAIPVVMRNLVAEKRHYQLGEPREEAPLAVDTRQE